MLEKLLTTSLYLIVGVLVLSLPVLAKVLASDPRDLFVTRQRIAVFLPTLFLAVAAVGLGLLIGHENYRIILCWGVIAGGAAVIRRRFVWPCFTAVLCGVIIGSTLPWWRHSTVGVFDVSFKEMCIYAVLCLGALIVLLREITADKDPPIRGTYKLIAVFVFLLLSVYLSFNTGIAVHVDTLFTMWHHWGAYVGPAELLQSGAHVFRDYPLQYGLGPTLLIAGIGQESCWMGMYYVVGFTTFLLAACIVCIAMSFAVRSYAGLAVIFIASLFACFFWASYGPMFSSPITTPSVSGLRFLPPAALVAMLLLVEGKARWASHWTKLGHFTWAFGAVWSPEALFCVSFVWWPYYCWTKLAECELRLAPRVLIGALANLIFVLLITILLFLSAYWFAYHDFPSAKAYLTYMLYPPGPMPLNPGGPVWFYVAVLILGSAALFDTYHNTRNSLEFKRNFLLLLLGYSVLSYCLGRSHDNNFLNLMPFSILILLGAVFSRLPIWSRIAAAALLVSTIGWISVFGWSVWDSALAGGRIVEFAPVSLTQSFTYENPEMAAKLVKYLREADVKAGNPEDAARALAEIRGRYHEPATVLDNAFLITKNGAPFVWSAIHAPVNYAYMSSEWRRTFLRRTAQRLHETGWLIVDKTFDAQKWIQDYKAVYDETERLDFDSYFAIRLVPKKGL
ncbi:MAG: hypothetical protein ABSH41_00205 [Syntrophobacteraceae bacterium]